MSESDVNPLALLELTVEGSDEEKESDSDVEFIDEIPKEKEIGLWFETQEAVANIINFSKGNGQVDRGSTLSSDSTTIQPQVENIFSLPHVPLFDLTEEQQVHNVLVGDDGSKAGESLTVNKRIKTTNGERMFRKNFFKENPQIGNFRLHCTICDVHLGTALMNAHRVKLHFTLRVLVCSKCYKHRIINNSKEHSVCTWCYTSLGKQQDKYVRCSKCPVIFCQVCIRRNLGLDYWKELESSTVWQCFICEPRQIWPHRVIACGLLRYLQNAKSQQLFSEDFTTDWTNCCNVNQPNIIPSHNVSSSSSTTGSPSQVGMALPKYKLPPPLFQMRPETYNVQPYANTEKSNTGRSVTVQGVKHFGRLQFTSQPQNNPIFLQSNNGTIQFDSDSVKRMLLQGNQSVTLNTGPQVIHNVYPNKRVVFVAQDSKGQQFSVLRTNAVPEELIPLHQEGNVGKNDKTNHRPTPLNNPTVVSQTPDVGKQLNVVGTGTFGDKNKFAFSFDKNGKITDISKPTEVQNPVTICNPTTRNHSPSILRRKTPENNATKFVTLTSLLNSTEKVNNSTGSIDSASSSHPEHPISSILGNANCTFDLKNPHRIYNTMTLVGAPSTSDKMSCDNTGKHPNEHHDLLSIESLLYNRSNTTNNMNSQSVPPFQKSTEAGNSMSLLKNCLTKGKQTDTLAAVETTETEDDVLVIEDDPSYESRDPIINFVDVQSDIVKEVNIPNILDTRDFSQIPTPEKDVINEPPRYKIKIKAIEELVDVTTNKRMAEQHCTEKQNSLDSSERVDISDEPQVDMKLLKQAIDGVQRVLISVIKSVRSSRATVKSFKDMKCKSLTAAKYISTVQNDIKMCTRQLNVIQSNIYEYYKDVPGTLIISEDFENSVNITKTSSITSDSVPIKDDGNLECKEETDPQTDVSNNTNVKSSNYHDNFTKFLSHYNKPVSKSALSRQNKQSQSNFEDNCNGFNLNESGTSSLKRKRPKLNFDLRNKRNISGSPVVTEEDLRNQSIRCTSNSNKNKHSTETDKYAELKKKYNIQPCSVLLHRLDPELIRLHQMS